MRNLNVCRIVLWLAVFKKFSTFVRTETKGLLYDLQLHTKANWGEDRGWLRY